MQICTTPAGIGLSKGPTVEGGGHDCQKQARKPRSYASSKLGLSDSLTGVKWRATSVLKSPGSISISWCIHIAGPQVVVVKFAAAQSESDPFTKLS